MLTFPAATLESKPWVTLCMIMFSVPTVVWRKFRSETKRMKLIAILVLYVTLLKLVRPFGTVDEILKSDNSKAESYWKVLISSAGTWVFKSYCTRPLLCNVQSVVGNFRELMPSDMKNTPCVFLNFIITENVKRK